MSGNPGSESHKTVDEVASLIADLLRPALKRRGVVSSTGMLGQAFGPVVLALIGGALVAMFDGSTGAVMFFTLLALVATVVNFSLSRTTLNLPAFTPIDLKVVAIRLQSRRVGGDRQAWEDPAELSPPTAVRRYATVDFERLERAIGELSQLANDLPPFLTADRRLNCSPRRADGHARAAFPLFDRETRIIELLKECIAAWSSAGNEQESISLIPVELHPFVRKLSAAEGHPFLEGTASDRGSAGVHRRSGRSKAQGPSLASEEARVRTAVEMVLSTFDSTRRSGCEWLGANAIGQSDGVHDASLTFLCRACNSLFLAAVSTKRFVFSDKHAIPALNGSARMRWRPSVNKWECSACGVRSATPLALPKLLVECLYPSFDVLMQEHHEARQAIYADIDNQKRHYKNEAEKELFHRRDAHRRDTRPLLAKLAELDSNAEALAMKLAAFGTLMAQWKILEEQRIDMLRSDAEATMARVRESQRAFEARFRDQNEQILSQAFHTMEQQAQLAQRETAAQFALLQRIAVASQETAAVQMAWAHGAGMLKPAAWNLGGWISYATDEAIHSVSGSSEVARFNRGASNE